MLERVNVTYMLVERLDYVLLMMEFKVCTLGSVSGTPFDDDNRI